MKINKWVVAFLMAVGLSVGAASLYMASFAGVMGKMGLVSGNFDKDINQNQLARVIREIEGSDCTMWASVKSVPGYLLAKKEMRVNLARELGEQRIGCGIRLVQSGNIERGVYSIVKGLYYLRGQYSEMRMMVEQDRGRCSLLPKATYEEWLQGYLGATQGRVHEVVFDLYKQVEVERAGVEELCSD